MHEHDGSGCTTCECSTSPMNTFPCTCPGEYRLKDRNQTALRFWNAQGQTSEYIGEMTQTKNGTDIDIFIRVSPEWSEVIDNGDLVIAFYPRPAIRLN